MAVDIGKATQDVGNALTSVKVDQMILSLAKGIAWGQFQLDQVGVDILKMMGAPGTVTLGGEKISMLDAGFTPSFYQFVDTILEIKMEVNIREESNTSTRAKETTSKKHEVGVKVSTEGGYNFWFSKGKLSTSINYNHTSAHSKMLDTQHSQKFSQDLSASSLIRTKIVPLPPPEILLERLRILLEEVKAEAERKKTDTDETRSIDEIIEQDTMKALFADVAEAMEA